MRKELNGMFTEGQLVIYGGEGVCRIAAVGPSSLSGTDKTKLYYTLTPLTRSGTVLTPVDTKVLMRPILSRQEAEDFIAQLPQLPPEEPESRSMRLLKEFYQQIVTSYDCRRMAGLIRSAVRRRKAAAQHHRDGGSGQSLGTCRKQPCPQGIGAYLFCSHRFGLWARGYPGFTTRWVPAPRCGGIRWRARNGGSRRTRGRPTAARDARP